MIADKAPRKGPKRILIDVTEYQHNTIKSKASECGVTLQRYILQAVQLRIDREYGNKDLSKLQ